MEKYELQKLRDLPIEGVAERLGLRVRMHKALCPFHDDHHASLSFSLRRNTFRCFVCGAHGGPIDLVMKHLNKPFLDACRWLADEHNVIVSSFKIQDSGDLKHETWRSAEGRLLPTGRKNQKPFDASRYERFFERPWLSDEARRFLFDERRLDERVVRWCRLTSWRDKQGVPWLQTPYYDREGKLVGVQNRNLNLTPNPSPIERGEKGVSPMGEGGKGLPRFRFPQGSECTIYNLPVLRLLRPGEPLYITEGCSDCWAMLSAGHKAIAIPSATLLSNKDKELLRSISQAPTKPPRGEASVSPSGDERGTFGVTFHMYPDNDVPGERLFLQLKEVLPSLVRHQLPAGCKDFSDYYLTTRDKPP